MPDNFCAFHNDHMEQIRELTANQHEVMGQLGMTERHPGSTIPGRLSRVEDKVSEIAEYIKEQRVTNKVLADVAVEKAAESAGRVQATERKLSRITWAVGIVSFVLVLLQAIQTFAVPK